MLRKMKFAKRLTFTYFSLVSFAIIFIHYSVYYNTFESIEQSIAQKRFDQIKFSAQKLLTGKEIGGTEISPHIFAYIGKENVPDALDIPNNLEPDVAVEVHSITDDNDEYFVIHSRLILSGLEQDVWFFDHKDIHGIDREDQFLSQQFQLLLSLVLLFISLLIVQRISSLLTDPLSQLAEELSHRSFNDLSPIHIPKGMITQEVDTLIHSINGYQQRLAELIDRERSFNNYASHELRTPLMIIKGAACVLKEYQNDEFSQKQCRRILDASDEMNEFISTLLSLTRSDDFNGVDSNIILKSEILDCIKTHDFLIEKKDLSWTLEMEDSISVHVPSTSIRILLANLVKNAFSYSHHGKIEISVSNEHIFVSDSGAEFGSEVDTNGFENNPHGHGLGLVIVTDICRKYGLEFSLKNNNQGGCVAEIKL